MAVTKKTTESVFVTTAPVIHMVVSWPFPGQPGQDGTRRRNHSGFCETSDDEMAVTSAGPCASHLHLAAQITGRMLLLPPSQQHQIAEGNLIT